MNHFTSIDNVGNPELLVKEALGMKYNPLQFQNIGKGKSICLIFFNPSLRTRLSTVRAAENLGLNISVLNIGEEGWQLEFEDGAIMDQGKAEHIKDAARVIGSYFDIIGLRSFPELKDKDLDYSERVLNQFIKYSGKPIISLESAILHPLQSLTDLITIRENSVKKRPRVVLSWAPHPRALPQAVANSFSQWMTHTEVDFIITHPEGLELDPSFTHNIKPIYNQKEAFKGADFIYAKNWSALNPYGKAFDNSDWMIDEAKMDLTNNARFMHCLPVRRNVVVSDQVLDSPNSLIIEQASNRLWAAQAVIKNLISG